MKTFIALVALAATALAQFGYDKSSAGFRLVLVSDSPTLNRTVLGACHEGAATEGLCITNATVDDPPTSYTTFRYNTSSSAKDDIDEPGILAYTLLLAGNRTVPSSMWLSLSALSNVAVPIISPGDSRHLVVNFDSCGSLYIPLYIDDSYSPPASLNPPQKVKNWYICTTYWAYTYTTLAWKVGTSDVPIQNPTCQKVDVKRVWN